MQTKAEKTSTSFKLTDPVCGMDVTTESEYHHSMTLMIIIFAVRIAKINFPPHPKSI